MKTFEYEAILKTFAFADITPGPPSPPFEIPSDTNCNRALLHCLYIELKISIKY